MAISDQELARAAQGLREMPEPGWDRIAESVIAAVRTTTRLGWPLAAVDPDTTEPPIPGAIEVSDLVLRGALARALRAGNTYAPTAIDVRSEGTTLQRICIEITARYGSRLVAAVEQVRAAAAEVVHDILGVGDTEHAIVVVVADVVAGDPLGG
jgi:hypothetical protein